jgi:hypothetical protein
MDRPHPPSGRRPLDGRGGTGNTGVKIVTEPLAGAELDAWRARYRRETRGQIVHDSLHRRPGWTVSLLLRVEGVAARYASTAVAGPWSGKPTLFELFLVPELRPQAAKVLTAFLAASGARHFEAQTNDELLADLSRTFGSEMVTERIVFEDMLTTALPQGAARFVCRSTEEEIRGAIAQRQGGGEWTLELAGTVIATGACYSTTTLRTGTSTWRLARRFSGRDGAPSWSRS